MPHGSGLADRATLLISGLRHGCYTLDWKLHKSSFPESTHMLRFDRLIRRDMIVRDVKREYPATVPVFESFGFRPVCDDCDIETTARKNGLDSRDIVEALNRAAFPKQTDSENQQ